MLLVVGSYWFAAMGVSLDIGLSSMS